MCCLFRLPQLFSTCMAFSLVADMGIRRGALGNWSMSFWCVCFVVTLVISTVDLRELWSRFPYFWSNFTITYACYATLICLSASIIYSITYVQFLPYGPYRDQANAFSCIASVNWYDRGDVTCYVHTVAGLLKVLETFMAGFIFTFIINTSLYLHQPALEWCVAVYSICFIPVALAILLNLGKWQCRLPSLYPIFQLVLSLLSVLLYVSALVLWALYQSNEEFGGQLQRSSDMGCINGLTYTLCFWDRKLTVAILTAVNLLVYVADTVYWARQISVGTGGQSSARDPLHSQEVSLQSSVSP
uniref:MARVEL domain-containing protein n=1 Tax=Capra hircus TaxID=9925 RepID=A0A452EQ95_CAPHI